MNEETICILHRNGSTLAGRTERFTKDTVRLGRRSDNDVVFDADEDRLVSGRHAEVRREGGRLVVRDLGSRNGTYVNGKQITGERTVGPGDRVSLGRGGAEFEVRLEGQDGVFGQTLTADAAGANTLAATGPSGLGIAASRRPVGLNTLMGVVDKATAHERRRVLKLVACTGAALAAVTLVGWWSFGDRIADAEEASHAARATVEQTRREMESGRTPFARTIERLRASTYLVLTVEGIGDSLTEFGKGTAWSVAPGLLATNAHVAQPFLELEDRDIMIARSAGGGADLRIQDVRMHPGYEEFNRMLAAYRTYDPNFPLSFFHVHSACDVALLEVDRRDVDKQAPPIPLADPASLDEIASGVQVATLGYPMEGMSGGGTDFRAPEPKSAIFPISNVTTAFLGHADRVEDRINLTFQLESAGGSSGSPVFNAQGRVVGLLSAGNFTGQHRDGSRDLGGGTMYGPRVDLLKELLDRAAEQAMPARVASWKKWFEQRHAKAMEDPRVPAGYLLHVELLLRGNREGFEVSDVVLVDEDDGRIRSTGTRGGFVARLQAPGPGWYALCAVAERPVRIGLRMAALGGYESEAETWHEEVSFRLPRGGDLEFEVFASPDEEDPATRVFVYLARAESE